MILTLINDSRVGVRLDEDDLGRLGIRFADMNLSSPAFSAALWLIKEEARQEGVDVDLTGRLLVEAVEVGDGVQLYLTALSPKKPGRLLTKASANVVMTADSREAVCLAASFLAPPVRVLRMRGRWYLLGSDADEGARAAASEFAELLPDPAGTLKALLEEYGEA